MLERYPLILLLSLFLLPTTTILAFNGRAVGVSHDDTITVMHDGKGEKVRIYSIDAPEDGQEFEARAKGFTSDFLFGKFAGVEPVATDRYGCTVGIVSIDGTVLDRALIVAGMAWVYYKYCTRDECFEWRRPQASEEGSGRQGGTVGDARSSSAVGV